MKIFILNFNQVPLVQSMAAYRELRADDLLTMMVPQQPLYPMSKIHVPVFLQPQPKQNIAVFIVRWAWWPKKEDEENSIKLEWIEIVEAQIWFLHNIPSLPSMCIFRKLNLQ